jgi:nucleoid-associated protein YgaU
MADLEALKQRYAPVIEEIQGFTDLGATLEEPSLDGEQLHLKATVPSTVVANRVWDVIKEVDPNFSDLHHEMATSGGDTQAYTIKAGDSLAKISQRFYGVQKDYMEIAEANSIEDPNKIQVGQELTLKVSS